MPPEEVALFVGYGVQLPHFGCEDGALLESVAWFAKKILRYGLAALRLTIASAIFGP